MISFEYPLKTNFVLSDFEISIEGATKYSISKFIKTNSTSLLFQLSLQEDIAFGTSFTFKIKKNPVLSSQNHLLLD